MDTNENSLDLHQYKLVARLFSPIVTLARSLENERLDLLAAERVADRFHGALDAVLSRIPLSAIKAGVVRLLRDDTFWSGPHDRPSPKASAFCAYFKALNAAWPYASTVLILESHFVRRGGFVDALRAIGHLQRATMARREHRAEWLRQSTVPIIESLFYEMVSLVYAAECLQQARPMSAKRGGAQLRDVSIWTTSSLPGLFRGDEGRIRNAAVHHDRWRYVHASNSVMMTDKGWSDQYPTQSLLKTMRSLLLDSALPIQVMLRVNGPDSRSMMQALMTPSPPIPAAVIEANLDRTISALRSLGWRPASERNAT